MTTSINEILQYSSIDLNTFEVRGIRYGINNAVTTGSVFSRVVPFIPDKKIIAVHINTASTNVISNCTFDAYPLMNTSSLRIGDTITINALSYKIESITGLNSFTLDDVVPTTGTNIAATMSLAQRDYVIEPDVIYNTSIGTGDFVSNDSTVYNISTAGLSAGYFIKSGSYQNYYKIKGIIDPNSLGLVSPFQGSTVLGGDYTAKKWLIGQTDIRYSNDNVAYDNQSARWTYSAITQTDLTTSTDYATFADGIELKFMHSLTTTAPDIMDVATVINKTLSTKTTYETAQYSLPVVPYAETMSLYINDILKDQFPSGNRDYVLTYSQSPFYVSPPPPDQRKIANIMFLKGFSNIQPSSSVTSTGQWFLSDSSGTAISNIMPGSETLYLDNTDQTSYKDYVLEASSGLMEVVDSIIDEPLVKYVGTNFSNYIDYGFSVYLNGVKQKISFPANTTTDDILFQPSSGTLKPMNQDHPGPGDIYEVHYMAAAQGTITDNFSVNIGAATLSTSFFPIKQDSLFIQSSYNDGTASRSNILSENTDYYVSYLTGKIFLINPTSYNTSFSVIYTPLSKQVNDLSYSDGTSYCLVHDSRLSVVNVSTFEFQFSNSLATINNVVRVYNETRNRDYDLSNYQMKGDKLWLSTYSLNPTIGLESTDVVVVDYYLLSDSVEYSPVEINYLNLIEGSKKVYLESVNVESLIVPGALVNVSLPDSATQFFSAVDGRSFDGTGTLINLSTQIPLNVTNPGFFITDASVSSVPLASTAEPFISGSLQLTFKNADIGHLLRPQSILKIDGDYYQVISTNLNASDTLVALNSGALRDYTNYSILSALQISDVPVYNEGQTIIYPALPVVDQVKQAAFIMNNNGSSEILSVITDTSAMSVDGTSLLYSNYPTLGDLSSAFNALSISSLSMLTYVPLWQSNKIVSSTLSVYSGSNTLVYADNALRYGSVDTTNFTQSGTSLTLTNPLASGDRYNFDYMGLRFLGDTTVIYSFNYFMNLAAGSKVSASFQYQNLDQFYAQVLSQKDFIETVTQPRMTEEANQLNGNVGQGGQVASADDNLPSNGGLYGDYYRKQDAEIETRSFKNIYDFFQDRLVSYITELESGTGLRLFNNDGTFSEEQQTAATLSINRIFPMNYTKMEPQRCNPLTGFFFNSGVYFTQGSNVVYNRYGWSPLLGNGNLIGRADSTKYYTINTPLSPTTIQLNSAFNEASTSSSSGERYMAAATLPFYDDDGYLGPKHVGSSSEASGFGLVSGDAFTCTIDSVDSTYTFIDPVFPYNLFLPSVSDLNITQIATNLTSNISGLKATVENVPDPSQPYGYRATLILRTSGQNYLRLGDTTTTTKLGFTRGAVAVGNYDRAIRNPEIFFDTTEQAALVTESGYLALMVGEANKLNRLTHLSGASAAIYQELVEIIQEIPKISSIVTATGQLIQEPSVNTYADSSASYYNAVTAYNGALSADASDTSNLIMDWVWPIDFQSNFAFITGIDGVSSFYLQAPASFDRRILNTTVDSTFRTPIVAFANDASIVGGTWYNHTPVTPLGIYSNDSTIIFLMNTPVVFTLSHGAWATDSSYNVTATNLNLTWRVDSTPHASNISLPSTTVAYVVSQVNLTGDITATANPACTSFYSSFLLNSGPINPTVPVLFGLRDVVVAYQTISDRLLTARVDFNSDRYDYLNNVRIPFLTYRESQIGTDLQNEELLRNSSGDPGNLYVWANNLYNRRQGSYARTVQIQGQIDSNQSALNINKSFL